MAGADMRFSSLERESFEVGPRERLRSMGVGALSDRDLLALVLRTGSSDGDALALAESCLSRFRGLAGLGSETTVALQSVRGLGPVKAASLQAAVELGRRACSSSLRRGHRISGPADVQRAFKISVGREMREAFHVILLDARHRVLSQRLVSLGTLTASLVHPREVFREAIREAAAAIVVVHNHPSGDPRPSSEDREVTRRLHSAGELLGIQVIDHVIVSDSGFYSFREREAELLTTEAGSARTRAPGGFPDPGGG